MRLRPFFAFQMKHFAKILHLLCYFDWYTVTLQP